MEGDIRRGVICDNLGCMLSGRKGMMVAHVRDQAALLEDCARAAIIVATVRVESGCSASLIIDADDLRTFGSQAVRFGDADGALKVSVTTERGAEPRPWQARGLPPAEFRTVVAPPAVSDQ